MALTLNSLSSFPAQPAVPGDWQTVTALLTGDNSYATGGYALSPSILGVTAVGTPMTVQASGGYGAFYNSSTQKIQVFGQPSALTANSGLPEVAASTNLSAVSFLVVVPVKR